MSLLRRQLIIIPLSALLGFLLAYVGFRNGLHQTVFGSPYGLGDGYNALGRIRPFNATAGAKADNGTDRKKEEVVPDGLKVKDLAVAVENGTLGFGKVFVVNLPHDAERKNTMVLATSFSKLKINWVDGLSMYEVNRATRFLSAQDQKHPTRQSQNIWRAHINAIRTTVEKDLSSALVLQDDLDWDIRIKEQMHTFALSTRTLTQPLAVKDQTKSTYVDSSFPDPSSSNKVTEIPYEDRPATIQPSISAYGDDWDVLWLGHCGMSIPTQKTPNLSKGHVVLTPDPTVALGDIIDIDGGTAKNQTRLYHHVHKPECALAYAVSQRGARRILYEVSLKNETENFDSVLSGLCTSVEEQERKLVCVTTQPSLFSRWRVGDEGSEHVRWSVRMNMGKYVRGDEKEWIDQYPD